MAWLLGAFTLGGRVAPALGVLLLLAVLALGAGLGLLAGNLLAGAGLGLALWLFGHRALTVMDRVVRQWPRHPET